MKRFALIWMFATAGNLAFAQEEPPDEPQTYETPADAPTRNFRIGVRAGFAYSTLSPGNLSNPKLIFGLTGGITARFKFGDIAKDEPEKYRAGIETQLNFSYKGSNFSNGVLGYKRISLFYIDLPVYAILKLNKPGTLKALAGPYGAYLMNSALYMEAKSYQDTTTLDLKKYDFGVGAGLEYKTRYLGIQFIVKQGLYDINSGLNPVNYPNVRPLFRGGMIRNFTAEFILSF